MKIELYHDILAKKVYEKASADEKMRLKIERFIRERYDFYRESNALMTANDLDYVTPYLDNVLLPPEQLDFIRESRRGVAADERRRRRRNLVIGSVLAIAAVVSIWFGVNAKTASRIAEEKRIEADSSAAKAERSRIAALQAEQAAKDSAEVAKAQRLAAIEAQQTAQQKEKEATEALNKLNTTRIQVVDVLIEQTGELILALDYEAARTKLNTAADLVSRHTALGKVFMELAFFYGETYRFAKAEESLQKTARLFGRPAVSAKVQQNADTLIYLNNLRAGLAELDREQFRKIENRYYPDMVTVAGGTFEMGCKEGRDGDCEGNETLHPVSLSTFQIARTETTVWQYNLYCEATGRDIADTQYESWGALAGHDPVIQVSWYDALAYANWVSRQRGKQAIYQLEIPEDPNDLDERADTSWTAVPNWTASGFRLPTEAEWEYAARGGIHQDTFQYAGSDELQGVGWYWENAGVRTKPVQGRAPNSLEIYDVSGNVWEWCWDWYGNYNREISQDPKGPDRGSYRVLRGGSWVYYAARARVALRNSNSPDYRNPDRGFRLARAVR